MSSLQENNKYLRVLSVKRAKAENKGQNNNKKTSVSHENSLFERAKYDHFCCCCCCCWVLVHIVRMSFVTLCHSPFSPRHNTFTHSAPYYSRDLFPSYFFLSLTLTLPIRVSTHAIKPVFRSRLCERKQGPPRLSQGGSIHYKMVAKCKHPQLRDIKIEIAQ